jgi:hypothetical protein
MLYETSPATTLMLYDASPASILMLYDASPATIHQCCMMLVLPLYTNVV